MAYGKNPRLSKGGKKGSKKRIVDPWTRKEWYVVRAPSMFTNRHQGKTPVNRTQGNKIASDGLKGRVFECNLADLKKSSEGEFHRKFKLICEHVEGNEVLTNFHGMSLTRDKLCSIVKKKHTLIEAFADCKTTDGYLLRLFCISFTHFPEYSPDSNMKSKDLKPAPGNAPKHMYAQHSKVKLIRKRMVDIMTKHVSNTDMKGVVAKLIPSDDLDTMSKEIVKSCKKIYPLNRKETFIRKVKVLKKPRFELSKIMELHQGGALEENTNKAEGVGEKIDKARPVNEPPVLTSV